MRLFDTTYIVDLTNEDAGAAALAKTVDEERGSAAISVISIHEYLFGVCYRYNKDERLKAKLASAKKDLSRFVTLPLTEEIAQLSAELHAELEHKGVTIGMNDVYIAATALHYKLRLVSRDLRHFKRIPALKAETY